MDTVIEVEGLHKVYRRFRGSATIAVRGLDLSVPRGGVFGFLGPNGSGKTTTIRCLLGLVAPTNGRTFLLGAGPSSLRSVIGRVGSIVEQPAYFPTFTGRRNLELLAGIDGISRQRVREALARVGLGDRGDDLFKNYSLGMKQRLGIAAALLKEPEVLILDEPANGLDPAGIKEIRDLLRTLGSEGKTVFVSSHLLGEVQQMCDRVAILSRGKLIATGPVSEVLARGKATGVLARVAEGKRALEVLRSAGFDVTANEDGSMLVKTTEPARISETLAKEKLYVSELRSEEINLEDVFLQLTSEPELES